MVEDGFRTGEEHSGEAFYLRHSRARPDIPSFLRRLADPVRHEFEKILEAGGQHGLLVERGGRHQITRSADASIVKCWPACARSASNAARSPATPRSKSDSVGHHSSRAPMNGEVPLCTASIANERTCRNAPMRSPSALS